MDPTNCNICYCRMYVYFLISDMQCDYDIRAINPGNFVCGVPPVKTTNHVTSKPACAELCSNVDGCHYFQLTVDDVTRETVCGVTDITDGV